MKESLSDTLIAVNGPVLNENVSFYTCLIVTSCGSESPCACCRAVSSSP